MGQQDAKSTMKKAKPLNLPSVGSVVSGKIVASGAKGVIVSVDGVSGRVKLSDLSTRFISGEEAAELFQKDSVLENLTVTAVTADKRLELKPRSRVGEPEVGSIHKAVVKRVERYGVIMSFPNSMIRCLCVTEDVDDDLDQCKPMLAKIQPGHKYNVKVIRVEQGKIWVTMKKSQLGDQATYSQPVMQFSDPNIQDSSSDSVIQIDTPTALAKPKLLDLAASRPDSSVPKRSLATVDALEEESETEEGKSTASRKKTKRQKDAAKREQEKQVRTKEDELLAGDWKVNPQTPDDFDRLLLIENQSSATWIKYISYWLKMAELGKARQVAERAVKHSFNLEQDKLNIWIAYLNMEAAFGTTSELIDSVFLRATQYCDSKRIYHVMPQVWLRAGNIEKAKLSFEKMTNKFHQSRKAWLNLIEFLFNQGKPEEARSVFAKAIRAIPKHKHVRVTVKFGQFEFRAGNPERGATIFEQLLSNNATKTDIWSIYFDEQIKAFTPPVSSQIDFESIRSLFEKAVSLKLKPFKTKFFFKRWIDFETKFGINDDGVSAVKERAVAYVESISQADE